MNQHTSDTRRQVEKYLQRRPKGRTAREIARDTGLGFVAVESCLRNNEAIVTVLHQPCTHRDGFFRRGSKSCAVSGRAATVWSLA